MENSKKLLSVFLAIILMLSPVFNKINTLAQSIPGDINNDGDINNKDITRFFQHLSNWDVEVNENALDINGDGDINNKDLTRLFQYLSGWNVKIYDTDSILQPILEKMPNYFKDYYQTTDGVSNSTYIDSKVLSVPNGQSFIFVTDMHYPENNKNSYYPMLYAYKKLHLDTVIHGGDVLHYTKNGKDIETQTLKKWTDEMRSCFGENMLPTYGNHDSNWAGMTDLDWNDSYVRENTVIPYKTVENIFLSGCKSRIVQETDEQIMQRIADTGITVDPADLDEFIAWYKLHYYSDDVKHKTRHIVLNYVGHNTIFKKYFGNRQRELWAQLNWLYETIQNTPDDYNIVVTSHIIIDWQNNSIVDNNANKALAEIFKMLSFAKNNEKNYILLDAGQDDKNNGYYITKEIDFSNHNRTGKIICLCGHSHWDYSCFFYPWYKGTHTITAEEAASKTFTLDFTPKENSNVDIIIGNIKYRPANSVATTYQGCCYIDRNTGKVYFSRYEAPFIEGAEIKISQWKSETYNDNSGLINDGILAIMTQTDAIRGANYTKEQRPNYPWDSLIQSPMIANTVTEQCFDIVTITDSGIVCTRIGAGKDRFYQY